MKKLTNYFFRGLIFLGPIAITLYIFYMLFVKIDKLLGFKIPGLGFLITIVAITLVGFLTSNFITRSVLNLIEMILQKLPFVRLLHTSIKDVLTAFVGERKRFDKPVLVTIFPGSDIKALGFMTRESLDQFDLKDQVAVYFPQSYNFAGNMLIYPKNQIVPLTQDSSRIMAFIVSGGITE